MGFKLSDEGVSDDTSDEREEQMEVVEDDYNHLRSEHSSFCEIWEGGICNCSVLDDEDE